MKSELRSQLQLVRERRQPYGSTHGDGLGVSIARSRANHARRDLQDYSQWQQQALVIDLWFNLQAQSPITDIAGIKN